MKRHEDLADRSGLNHGGSEPVVLDRMAERRRDVAWIKEMLHDRNSRFLPLWRSKNLFAGADQPCPVFLSMDELGDIRHKTEFVFLGNSGRGALFAVGLPDSDETIPETFSSAGVFQTLLKMMPVLAQNEYSVLAYARGMILWHRKNRYCSSCGWLLKSREGGHMLLCSNPDCGMQHFPRIDPAIIMRVCEGERCLMARQSGWRKGLFSVLAGFVEPGETLEDTVKRECMEEAGVRVHHVRYFASQAWPFPSSLMLGFTAELESGSIWCADNELEDVRWFARDEVRHGIMNKSLILPVKGTLSCHLILDWLNG